MYNMRTDAIYVLFINGLNTPKTVAKSETIYFNNTAKPMHVHIARTQNIDEMRIMWVSKYADNPTVLQKKKK